MNGKDLLDKMSDVDPKLIENAENSNRKPKNKRRMFIELTSGMAAVAAAAVLAVAIGKNPAVTPPIDLTSDTNSGTVSGVASNTEINSGVNSEITSTPSKPEPQKPKDPPVIDFSQYERLPLISRVNYGLGGGGDILNSISNGASISKASPQLHSPWNAELGLKTLPVYKSTSTEADMDAIREYVKKTAAKLGISENELELREPGGSVESNLAALRKMMEDAGVPEEEIERELAWRKLSLSGNATVETAANGINICINTAYGMDIRFDEPIKLPDGCKLGGNASEEENIAAVEYLAEKFRDVLGYEDPVIAKCDDDIRDGYYCVYENAGTIEEQILNYSTKYTVFYEASALDDPGLTYPGLMGFMRIHSNENCVKLDDYPIYTPEQAIQILQSNKYSDDERMPEDAEILKVDITYGNYAGFTVVLPYYEIYTDSETDDTCDIYRICAVPEQFVDIQNSDYGVSA